MPLLKKDIEMKNALPLVGGESISKPQYWRSLEEYSNSAEFEKFVEREFPEEASVLEDPISRRRFVQIMGSSLAFAGLTACRMPKEKILPYVKDPEGLIPGKARYYASAFSLQGNALGVLAKSSDGRPTKIEGNLSHPQSKGAVSSFAQASVLSLFDPDRLKKPMQNKEKRSWEQFVEYWRGRSAVHRANRGKGLVLISESQPSRSYLRLRAEFLKVYPQATWLTYEPTARFSEKQAFLSKRKEILEARYDLSKADVIVSFAEDFLNEHPEHIRLTREFAERRKVGTSDAKTKMNRLYVVESAVSVTGTNADNRLARSPKRIDLMVKGLARRLGATKFFDYVSKELDSQEKKWIDEMAVDLLKYPGRSVLMGGSSLSPLTLVNLEMINAKLGNLNSTVRYEKSVDPTVASYSELKQVTESLKKLDSIESLIVVGGNPAYNLPNFLDWQGLQEKAKETLVLSEEANETTLDADWVLPKSHYLEAWGDLRSVDGFDTITQPLIAPLYQSKSALEFLYALTEGDLAEGYGLVRTTWESILGSAFESKWQATLHDGQVKVAQALPGRSGSRGLGLENKLGESEETGAFELVFRTSSSTFDGRFANNAWLQETPHPVTKVVWNNPALISPNTAKKLKVKNEQLIEITAGGRSIKCPVWIMPGQADQTIVLDFGYGRQACGLVGRGVGSNVYPLFDGSSHRFANAKKVSGEQKVTTTQNHWSMEGRPIVRSASLEFFKKHPTFAKEAVEHPPLKSLWEEKKYDEGYQWGMNIDLSACIGCTSCSLACQSENNIPVVGEDQVARGREMNWMRIDRYFEGDESSPEFVHQPVMCQHCENAPCEQVCPVNATVHDDEGLNAMTYNRCIGTRYCSNNCPYKVRRFNFLDYTSKEAPSTQMVRNPNVTVRSRGVMEKCTYCIQRINEKKFEAKVEGKILQEGDVQTACQQSCPAGAIEFGNILEKGSQLVKNRNSDRAYHVLSELNTKPRTTYLAKIKNPNEKLLDNKGKVQGGHA